MAYTNEFMAQLEPGDILIQPYGQQYSEALWGHLWWVFFSVQAEDRCANDPRYTLKLEQDGMRVYHAKHFAQH